MPTELQLAKIRHDEALQIRDAWQHRYNIAHDRHRLAPTTGADQLQTKRELAAVELHLEDAIADARVKQAAWVELSDMRLGRGYGRRAA